MNQSVVEGRRLVHQSRQHARLEKGQGVFIHSYHALCYLTWLAGIPESEDTHTANRLILAGLGDAVMNEWPKQQKVVTHAHMLHAVDALMHCQTVGV